MNKEHEARLTANEEAAGLWLRLNEVSSLLDGALEELKRVQALVRTFLLDGYDMAALDAKAELKEWCMEVAA